MASKKKSGFQNRMEKLKKEEANKRNSTSLQNWLKNRKENEGNIEHEENENSNDNLVRENQFENFDNSCPNISTNNNNLLEGEELQNDNVDLDVDSIVNCEDEVEKEFTTEKNLQDTEYTNVAFNNPKTWNVKSDKFKSYLISHGPVHVVLKSYPITNGRSFTNNWKYKKMNFEEVERKWLFYSKANDAIYCFPCLLFTTFTHKKIFSCLEGYKDWKHLNPNVNVHENSLDHINNFTKWKLLEKMYGNGGLIDDCMQNAINSEVKKWKHILNIILQAILFCAQNNLPLRGISAKNKDDSGIFLNLIKYTSHFDITLKNILDSHVKHHVSYLSPQIQNEFINLLGKKVRDEIIKEIQQAKYYCIIFDSTPDFSHKDQLSQIIRYVKYSNGKYVLEERFVDFINTKNKTGEAIAAEIKKKIIADGLKLENIRGQGYDNGRNMSGKYKGVQAIISNENSLARFFPCCAHSLNLLGVNAASADNYTTKFFRTIQSLYNFFSSSTDRWEKISLLINVSLKKHSDTRWCSKLKAVKAVCDQYDDIIAVLNNMKNDPKFTDSHLLAKSLYFQMYNYNFLLFLYLWNLILDKLNKVNIALQKKDQDIYRSSLLIQGLVNDLKKFRENGIDEIFVKVIEHCTKLNIKPDHNKRNSKRKTLLGELAEDESPKLNLAKNSCYYILDNILMQLEERFQCIQQVAKEFYFLTGEGLLTLSEKNLEKEGITLSKKYLEIDGNQFLNELKCLKNQLSTFCEETDPKSLYHIDILNILGRWDLQESYPNVELAIRTFITMPTTVASAERSFSKLKIIKNYLRSTSGQERLSNLSILSIESELASNINFDEIITDFANAKARKIRTHY